MMWMMMLIVLVILLLLKESLMNFPFIDTNRNTQLTNYWCTTSQVY